MGVVGQYFVHPHVSLALRGWEEGFGHHSGKPTFSLGCSAFDAHPSEEQL